jgi:hypothetical protein
MKQLVPIFRVMNPKSSCCTIYSTISLPEDHAQLQCRCNDRFRFSIVPTALHQLLIPKFTYYTVQSTKLPISGQPEISLQNIYTSILRNFDCPYPGNQAMNPPSKERSSSYLPSGIPGHAMLPMTSVLMQAGHHRATQAIAPLRMQKRENGEIRRWEHVKDTVLMTHGSSP